MPRVFRRTWKRGGVTHTSPWYYLEYAGPDGRKVRRRTDPPAATAKVAKEQLHAALARVGSRAERVSVQRVLDAYAGHLETHSASYYRRLGRYVLAAWGRAYGARPVGAFGPEDVDAFVRSLRARDLSDSSLAAHLTALRAAFRRAVRTGLLPAHPVTSVGVPYQAAERHVVWTDEELQAVAAALPAWARPVLLLLRATGLRVGDALALRWEVVQGRPVEALRLRQEKTGEPLDIPLSAAARAVLEALERKDDVPWLFPARGAEGPRLVSTFRRAFYAACRAAGVSGKTIHDIRRTFATRAWNAGVSPAIIAKTLGQGSTRLVSRYTHAEVATLRAAVELGSYVPPFVSPNHAAGGGNMRKDADAEGAPGPPDASPGGLA